MQCSINAVSLVSIEISTWKNQRKEDFTPCKPLLETCSKLRSAGNLYWKIKCISLWKLEGTSCSLLPNLRI